jgi:N-acetylmuramoyl-L-alanine amidase
MASSNSFKRRLLRAAVQENVDAAQGRWPRLHSQPRFTLPPWLGGSAALAVAFAFVALGYAVVTVPEDRVKVTDNLPPVSAFVETGASRSEPSAQPTMAVVDSAASVPTLPSPASETVAAHLPLPEPNGAIFKALALPVKTILIDPGHGGDDPGAVAAHGVTEKAVALDISLRLRALLEAASFQVRMTREKDETLSLMRRVLLTNAEDADLFVSIHINWVEPRSARVVETYYLGPTNDSAALQLAGLENQPSGYSLTDFRRLLNGVYESVRREESRVFAEVMQSELVRGLRKTNPTLEHRAVKPAPFLVLLGASIPAVLTEVSCLSNKEEAALLSSPEYRQQIAQALFAGIRSYVENLYRTETTRKESAS